MIYSQELKCDINRYGGNQSLNSLLYIILKNSGARYMFLYRMCNRFNKKNPLGIIVRVWIKLLSNKKNIEIPHATSIQGGLYFGHFKNITINQNVKIGRNCNIMQGVTIGNESRGQRKGTPKIGDRVLIGPNSVITGNIIIGDDVLIGPLTFINFDVPSNSVVIGNPAKIVSSKGSKGYINKILLL
jgi:serine O-acetyltransferase